MKRILIDNFDKVHDKIILKGLALKRGLQRIITVHTNTAKFQLMICILIMLVVQEHL